MLRRKYVPKLLKELHATGVFDEAQMAALNKAKAAVTGKEQITDAELENLKAIGARLAGY